MSKTRILLALPIAGVSALSLAVACSSSDPGAASTTQESDAGPKDATPPPVTDGPEPTSYTRIDDMEGTSGAIEWTVPGTTTRGIWGTNVTDPAQDDHISPIPWTTWSYAALPSPYETFPGITSGHAARLRTTQPLVGANTNAALSIVFGPPPGVDAPLTAPPARMGFGLTPVDLRAFTGITFWAMGDPNQDTTTIRVQIFDKNTFPEGGACLDADGGTGNCYNGFATTRNLTGAFAQYTIDFSTLIQNPTWGFRPAPDVLDLQNAYVLVFGVNPPSGSSSFAFDVWIDDLYFVDK
jgi:hypothetical protein